MKQTFVWHSFADHRPLRIDTCCPSCKGLRIANLLRPADLLILLLPSLMPVNDPRLTLPATCVPRSAIFPPSGAAHFIAPFIHSCQAPCGASLPRLSVPVCPRIRRATTQVHAVRGRSYPKAFARVNNVLTEFTYKFNHFPADATKRRHLRQNRNQKASASRISASTSSNCP